MFPKKKCRKWSSRKTKRLSVIKKKQKRNAKNIQREAELLQKEHKKLQLSLTHNVTTSDQPEKSSDTTITESDPETDLNKTIDDGSYAQDAASDIDCSYEEESLVCSEKTLIEGCIVLQLTASVSSTLVALQAPNKQLKLHGRAKITAIKGAFRVNGFSLKRGDTTVVVAPVTHPAVTLLGLDTNEDDSICISHTLDHVGLCTETETDSLDSYGTVALFQSVFDEVGPRTLPGYPDIYRIKSSEVSSIKQLCTTCWACKTNRYFKEQKRYQDAARTVLSFSSNSSKESQSRHKQPVILTAGVKNVGKSTFNRYLINRLFDSYDCVYYLECDVGQTEFTPSGFISIHCIEKQTPLIGPPFTHQIFPKHTCYFGNKTPAGDPDRYIDCIRYVFYAFLEELSGEPNHPLVINTMGWIRGLGFHLLVDIIRMIAPTHIMQFNCAKESQNLEALTPAYVSQVTGWMSTPQKVMKHELVVLHTKTVFNDTERYKAPDHRHLSLLSHLSTLMWRCLALQGTKSINGKLHEDIRRAQPYEVKLSNLAVCNATDNHVKYKFVLAALNASTVGLCVLPKEVANPLKNPPKNAYLHKPPVCPCVGIGIIRGVDPSADTVYIVCDLSKEEVTKVNCLTLGHLTIPEPLLLGQEKAKRSHHLPYATKRFPYETIGAGTFKVHKKFKLYNNQGQKK